MNMGTGKQCSVLPRLTMLIISHPFGYSIIRGVMCKCAARLCTLRTLANARRLVVAASATARGTAPRQSPWWRRLRRKSIGKRCSTSLAVAQRLTGYWALLLTFVAYVLETRAQRNVQLFRIPKSLQNTKGGSLNWPPRKVGLWTGCDCAGRMVVLFAYCSKSIVSSRAHLLGIKDARNTFTICAH
jgi:hypothetical protein